METFHLYCIRRKIISLSCYSLYMYFKMQNLALCRCADFFVVVLLLDKTWIEKQTQNQKNTNNNGSFLYNIFIQHWLTQIKCAPNVVTYYVLLFGWIDSNCDRNVEATMLKWNSFNLKAKKKMRFNIE